MDEAHLAFMRERLKFVYRSRLPEMGWCDDNARRKQQVCAQPVRAWHPLRVLLYVAVHAGANGPEYIAASLI